MFRMWILKERREKIKFISLQIFVEIYFSEVEYHLFRHASQSPATLLAIRRSFYLCYSMTQGLE